MSLFVLVNLVEITLISTLFDVYTVEAIYLVRGHFVNQLIPYRINDSNHTTVIFINNSLFVLYRVVNFEPDLNLLLFLRITVDV